MSHLSTESPQPLARLLLGHHKILSHQIPGMAGAFRDEGKRTEMLVWMGGRCLLLTRVEQGKLKDLEVGARVQSLWSPAATGLHIPPFKEQQGAAGPWAKCCLHDHDHGLSQHGPLQTDDLENYQRPGPEGPHLTKGETEASESTQQTGFWSHSWSATGLGFEFKSNAWPDL